MINDLHFWDDEAASPLLSRGFERMPKEAVLRVQSWEDLLPALDKTRSVASGQPDAEALRIFQRDAERTFIDKKDTQVQERTAARQQLQVDNLKAVHGIVQDYHQGMGFLVAFLQLFLDCQKLLQVIEALHRSPRHSAGYFKSEPQAFVRDARVLKLLMDEEVPDVAHHLARLGAVPELYAVKWFVGLAVHVLPLSHLLDFWEAYFQYGYEWSFAFGIEFVREFRSELLAEPTTAGVMTILRLEDPRAEWRYPPKLQHGLEERLARVNLAAIELIAVDQLKSSRLEGLRDQEAAKVAEDVERAARRMAELEEEDDGIVFSDEEDD